MKIAALGDIHTEETNIKSLRDIFRPLGDKADVLLILGDLTGHGLTDEATILAEELALFKIPILTVLGNHDYDNDKQEEIKKILQDKKVFIFDGNSQVIQNVGFAGVKGYCGGFGHYMMPVFGEETNKKFAMEAVSEALKLEGALSRLQTKEKVVLLHYSPIEATVKGESCEIFPFLGSTHLEEPINTFGVTVVFHGHSHLGTIKGQTSQGVPVFNTSLPLLLQKQPDNPYIIFEV